VNSQKWQGFAMLWSQAATGSVAASRCTDSFLLILLKNYAMVPPYAVEPVTQPVPKGTIFLTDIL
jgi:hypothetical protein